MYLDTGDAVLKHLHYADSYDMPYAGKERRQNHPLKCYCQISNDMTACWRTTMQCEYRIEKDEQVLSKTAKTADF